MYTNCLKIFSPFYMSFLYTSIFHKCLIYNIYFSHHVVCKIQIPLWHPGINMRLMLSLKYFLDSISLYYSHNFLRSLFNTFYLAKVQSLRWRTITCIFHWYMSLLIFGEKCHEIEDNLTELHFKPWTRTTYFFTPTMFQILDAF